MGRQTGSQWGRDEDSAREPRGGPRRPGSRKTALGSVCGGSGVRNGGVYSVAGEAEDKGPQKGAGWGQSAWLLRRPGRGRPARNAASGSVGASGSEATIAAR